jgi:hypothetical protein
MSEKKLEEMSLFDECSLFEECKLEEATHVEMGGKLHELGDGNVIKIQGGLDIYMKHWNNFLSIYECVFSVLAIKPMKKKKREPIECMAITVIAQRNGKDVVALLPTADFELGMTVRCVEILEENEK